MKPTVIALIFFQIAIANAILPLFAAQANQSVCRPVCCDAIFPSIRPKGNAGINCSPGGIDCGYHGQTQACCQGIVPIGARTGTGVGCV